MNHAILLISCPDQKGITAGITNFIFENNGNIIHADQHIDEQSNTFFMRIEWALDGFTLSRETIAEAFKPLAEKFAMQWELSFQNQLNRVAIFVSKHLHCLQDILIRHKTGHLNCEIALVISNHACAKPLAGSYQIPFYEFPITPDNKLKQEGLERDLLRNEGIDLVVLARYHQIFTKQFVDAFDQKMINIHHSFLPAFAGQQPYRQAFDKGVKIIGATSHFVTEELDQGPIIEQDTVRISHRDSLEDLVQKGEDLEKSVLARALRWALERKILCYGNKTVVFD